MDKKECVEKIKKAQGISRTTLLRRKHLKDCQCVYCFTDKTLIDLAEQYLQEQPREDAIFINHIQAHLPKDDGSMVICKICGKTAKEIINESKKETSRG